MSDEEFGSPVPSSSGVPTRLLRRLSIHNDKIDDSPSLTPTRAPQLAMRSAAATASPPKRQLKNYDMKELENRNGGLGWVGPIYGNKTHSSKRYASPVVEDREQATAAVVKQRFAEKKRRESLIALEEMYPAESRRSSIHRQSVPDVHEQSSGHRAKASRSTNSRHGGESGKDARSRKAGHSQESALIMEQKRLLQLLQDNIRAEQENAARKELRKPAGVSSTRHHSSRHSHGDGGRRVAPAVRKERSRNDSDNKRHSYPISQRRREVVVDNSISPSDASARSGASTTSSSDSEEAFERANPYADDQSVSSLDADMDEEHYYNKPPPDTETDRRGRRNPEEQRGRGRNGKRSTNRVRYEANSESPSRGAGGPGHQSSAHVRLSSPTNTSSTVAAARAGISHNFFELYGGRPGGVRVPDKIKISSMIDKATPIRNRSPAEQHSTRRRLASPTVASGRRFHTPELDRVRSRRGVSADSYVKETDGGLTDAAEWSRLTDWLGRLKLQKYAGLFRRSGITKLSLVELLRGHDLAEIGIDLNDHQRILHSIQDFSHRTISFAEQALSPHEERLQQNNPQAEKFNRKSSERQRSGSNSRRIELSMKRDDEHFITAKDVLTGDRRPGGAYRPMSTEDLLQLGSPNPLVVPTLLEKTKISRMSQSQEVKRSTASPAQSRMNRSSSDMPAGPQASPNGTGIIAVLNSTPTTANTHKSQTQASKVLMTNPIIESTLLSLNKAFWVGDEGLFYKIWDTVASDLGSRTDVSPAVVQASQLLELFSRVYFVTWPQRAQIRGLEGGVAMAKARFRAYVDRVLENPDPYSTLLKSREFATFVGIGMLPDAASNAAYASIFKPEWADGLARRLNSFLSSVMVASAPSKRHNPHESTYTTDSIEMLLGGGLNVAAEPIARTIAPKEIVLGLPGTPAPPENSVKVTDKVSDECKILSHTEETERSRSSESSESARDADSNLDEPSTAALIDRTASDNVCHEIAVVGIAEENDKLSLDEASNRDSNVASIDIVQVAQIECDDEPTERGDSSHVEPVEVEETTAEMISDNIEDIIADEQSGCDTCKSGGHDRQDIEYNVPPQLDVANAAANAKDPLEMDDPVIGAEVAKDMDSKSIKIGSNETLAAGTNDNQSEDELDDPDQFKGDTTLPVSNGGGGNKKKRRKSKAK